MAISRFGSLQKILTSTLEVICRTQSLCTDEVFAKVEEFIKSNSENWRQPTPDIDYGDPFCRMAYLYMNVAIHANLVEEAISANPELGELIQKHSSSGETIRFCVLGGGPGSELLGVIRYIELEEGIHEIVNMDFALVDRTQEWDESWYSLKEGIDEELHKQYGNVRSKWPVCVSRSFLALDAINQNEYKNYPTRFSKTNIFVVCYLSSELKGSILGFQEVVNLLVQGSSQGSFWLFIDRDEKTVRDSVLNVINSGNHLEEVRTVRSKGYMPDDPTELAEWYINIEATPRKRWLTFFTLAVKK